MDETMLDDIRFEPIRRGTRRKCIWLTNETRAAIQAWADANQTGFSAALETLARLGLGEPVESAMTPVLASVVRRAVLSQMERFAKLAATAAIQSGMASNLSRAVLRLAIQNRAKARPRDFEDTIFDIDEGDPAEIVYQQVCRNARQGAARRLQAQLEELLAEDEASLATPQESPREGNR